MRITHVFFGLGSPVYEHVLGEVEAHRLIGANVVAGFEAVTVTQGADGAPLTTPDGALLKVVALYGASTGGVYAVVAFTWGA
ncbi:MULTISPECIES: hypothetical protein [Streptomyces]|uniref:Uncharacterized protein n=2 Tax=Streptomyces TaxID=1883 RepID=A0ABU4KDQ4_9ACTN|nr:hypothetical protein [Streptomyces roseolus]MDX2295871.1 hypothetical protein [Streptomyces roseolus]